MGDARGGGLVCALATAMLLSAPAAASCRLALALGLDVSGSVDAQEYRLQLDGLAAALEHPEVQGALFDFPGQSVALAVYPWAGVSQQRLLVRWAELGAPADLQPALDQLRGTQSRFSDPSTGIGAAMRFGAALLAERTECWRRTLDISGDGPSNSGPHPGDVQMPDDITVNALVLNPSGRDNVTKDLTHTRTLLDHYRQHVLRGPGAFVETAQTFADFRRAMTRKLLRELRPATLSLLDGTAKQDKPVQ